jgi:beta-1,4-N-acetylglucosaminyltransferase
VIFVTVGTSDFDLLVEKIDELAPILGDRVIVQIGLGNYIPKNCEYFRFAPSLAPYYDQATLVISQGGMGTTMEVLTRGKKLIGVENTTCVDAHQIEILSVLAQEEYLIWCRNLDDLSTLLQQAPTINLKTYVPPPSQIAEVIKNFLNQLG